MILFFLISIVVAIFFAIQFSKEITKPLSILTQTSNKVSSNDLSVRTNIHTEDEIGELARSFDNMLDKLENAYHEIEISNNTLEERVKERTPALEKEIH